MHTYVCMYYHIHKQNQWNCQCINYIHLNAVSILWQFLQPCPSNQSMFGIKYKTNTNAKSLPVVSNMFKCAAIPCQPNNHTNICYFRFAYTGHHAPLYNDVVWYSDEKRWAYVYSVFRVHVRSKVLVNMHTCCPHPHSCVGDAVIQYLGTRYNAARAAGWLGLVRQQKNAVLNGIACFLVWTYVKNGKFAQAEKLALNKYRIFINKFKRKKISERINEHIFIHHSNDLFA